MINESRNITGESWSPRGDDVVVSPVEPNQIAVVYHAPRDRRGVARGEWYVGRIRIAGARVTLIDADERYWDLSTCRIGLSRKNAQIASWIRYTGQARRDAIAAIAKAEGGGA